jgi:F-type H+-transporting ATPase subunit h
MYLKELRAYKIPQPKPNDAEGQVQKFTAPLPPKSLEETNLASEMKAYEEQQVEIEGQASTEEVHEPKDDYFEDLKQFDEDHPEGAAH